MMEENQGQSSGIKDSQADCELLDLADEEGWEDLEPDVEVVHFHCLMCDKVLDNTKILISHCNEEHKLDLQRFAVERGLDFMGMVKVVNYIRSEVMAGRTPDLSQSAASLDDRYLQPALQDDALLFNLHDIIGEELDYGGNEAFQHPDNLDQSRNISRDNKIVELEDKLQRAQHELDARRLELETLKLRFGEFITHEPTGNNFNHGNEFDSSSGRGATGNAILIGNTDSSYFASYSGHEIHETMLKDTVRTDAYRDFIYENKSLFQGKIVLDVGCGTGILSMFACRAGAAKVIAVDNSDIIDCARENVFKNGMGGVISCLRGKIEEVSLPVDRVDIVVSEWMGYCLLYEAMLDSVIWARDKYLKKDGLMIPSHCTLRIGPLTDAEYIEDHIDHWKNVYGFDMISMHKDIYKDVMVREVQDFSVPAQAAPFLRLRLKDVTTEELSWEDKSFNLELSADMEALDGFVIWFDTFFLTDPKGQVPLDLKAEDCKRDGGESIAFTTGPHGKRTHWQQGVLLIDHRGEESIALRKGQKIEGTIGYKKGREDNRALDIALQWQIVGDPKTRRQSWSMR